MASSIPAYESNVASTRGPSLSANSASPAGFCRLLALLPLLLLRPRGKDLVNGVRQRSILLLRRAVQLRLQLRLNKRANEFGACFHAATVGHSRRWQQRTLVPI